MCGFNHTVRSFFFIHKKTEVKPSPLPRSLPLRTNFGSDLRHIGNENNKRSGKAKTTETSTVCTKRQTVGITFPLPTSPLPTPQQQSTWRNTSWTKRPSSHYATLFFCFPLVEGRRTDIIFSSCTQLKVNDRFTNPETN